MKTIIIIGGGPAGMMAAWSSKKHHPQSRVILFERNRNLGKKLALTGGGRCNVTANVSNDEVIKNVVKNGNFLYSSLTHFGPKEIIEFFESKGCPLVEEDHHRMFPKSEVSKDIINTLEKALKDIGVEIVLDSYIESVDDRYAYFNSDKIAYDALILSAGSKTLPGTGSDGSGYTLAQSMGHTLTELLPAEVPLVSNDTFIQEKTLQGLSFNDVNLQVFDSKGKRKRNITHDILFTHFGLSGPAALRASFDIQKLLKDQETVNITLDFIPSVSINELNDDIIGEHLPKRLVKYLESIEDVPTFELIKRFPITVYDTRGFSHAFVTNGGISIKEVDPKTMKSKINPKLSLCGEVLDISAYTGGFNITTAFTTGYTAGKFVIE